MVILLIGSGVLVDGLINKLNKNGHRVYWLTGSDKGKENLSYHHVFEKYNFTYESESIKNILESTNPDVTIFSGAFDTNYTWNHPDRDAVNYISGLTNILTLFSMQNRGKFLYLSSQEIYGKIYLHEIEESEPPSPKGFRAMALAQGEEICKHYRNTQGTKTITLRLDHLYWIPKKGEILSDPGFQLSLQALKTGRIVANPRKSYSVLYLKDALEQIYHLICAKDPKSNCYNITSSEEINELDLAHLIQENMEPGVQVIERTVGPRDLLILDGNRFQKEFGRKIFNHYETTIPQVVDFMSTHSDLFLTQEDIGGGIGVKIWTDLKKIFKALFPYFENLVCFLLVLFLHQQASNNEFLAKLDFYILYVLLFALIYGQRQAIISSFLAVIGYIFWNSNIHNPFEVLVDYATYVWMVQIFIVGLAVGHLKDQLSFVKGENRITEKYYQEQLKDLEEINDSNVRMKHHFESQVVNQKDSLGKIYEISSSLEQYGPEEVLFYACQVLSQVMDCPDVAIYTVANGDYARLFSSTSQNARKLGNSIKYTDMKEMYEALKERRVYINRRMNKEMPMMVSAVYSESKMVLIFMLWRLPWERMTLAEANRLSILGSLIQNAVLHSTRYLEALHDRRYIKETNVLDESAFTPLVKAFFEAQNKGLTEYTLLKIDTNKPYKEVGNALSSLMRRTDYLGLLNKDQLYALLSNTKEEQASIIIERFKKNGYSSYIAEVIP